MTNVPAPGGAAVRIRNVRDPANDGTLGCLVRRRGESDRYLLTAGHVIAFGGYAERGDAIEALDRESGRWVKIAEFAASYHLRDVEGAVQPCDAAIARITDDTLVERLTAGTPAPVGFATPFIGMPARFCGGASNFVAWAEIRSLGDSVPMRYIDPITGNGYPLTFGNQILYALAAGSSWNPATHGGDSGALITDVDGLAVGLHLGTTAPSAPLYASVCTPIRVVLEGLDLELPNVPPAIVLPASNTASPVSATTSITADDAAGVRSFESFGISIRSLIEPHNPFGGVTWKLTRTGLIVDDHLDRTPGALVTIPRVWRDFRDPIVAAARTHKVPIELIVATLCTESSGNPRALRMERGYIDDERTPSKVSPGLMQTLISTARDTMQDPALDRDALFVPATSIDAGTAYISQQRHATRLDPPLVACAYNAGHLELNASAANRWQLRQFPIGTGDHCDRFVQWFNDCFAFFAEDQARVPSTADAPSFFAILNELA